MNPRFPRPGLNREAVAPSRRFVTQPLALRLLSVVCIAWASASASHACTIPVFRFALDRWEADPFRLVIPSSWGTQPEMIRLLVPLRGNSDANVRVAETSDASVTEAKLLFPRDDTPVWSGKLDATTLPGLLD